MNTMSRVTCPDCKTVLKPGKPIPEGKKIKCPKCGVDFIAMAGGGSQDLAIGLAPEPEPEPRPREKSPEAPPRKKAAKPGPSAKAVPAKKAKKPADDDEVGSYGVVEEEESEAEAEARNIEYAPDTSTKDLRGPAQAMIIQPTNSLIVSGIIGFIGWLVLLVLILIPVLFPLNQDFGTKDSPREVLKLGPKGMASIAEMGKDPVFIKDTSGAAKESAMKVWGIDLNETASLDFFTLLLCLLPILLGMGYAGLLAGGAVKAQNMESREWGIAACIMVMIPINHCGVMMVVSIFIQFILSMIIDDRDYVQYMVLITCIIICLGEIALGAWALKIFMKPEVVDGFAYQAE